MTTSRQRLHIVVTCTNRKRHAVPARLQLRRTPGVRPSQRAARWVERLTTHASDRVPAEQIYSGEHWDTARSLPGHATAFSQATLWVASAGWGLIPADALIRPYSATFSPRHADSVASDFHGAQTWWNAIAGWAGPVPGRARSLTALVADHPRDRVLIVLSDSYVRACASDLRGALDGSRPGQVSIIAAGHALRPDLAAWQLPADARLQYVTGGSRGALNARLAAELLQAGLSDHDAMNDRLRLLLGRAPNLTVYDRRRLSDDDVIGFINTRYAADPWTSRTRLLRELRDAGMACEQARFGELFTAAVRSAT